MRARFGAFLERVCSQLKETGFDWAGIYWLRGGRLELVAYSGPYTMRMRLDVGEGVAGRAAEGGEMVWAETLGDLWEKEQKGVCVAVPIKAEGRVLGVLGAGYGGRFDVGESVEALLEAVADEISRRFRARGQMRALG